MKCKSVKFGMLVSTGNFSNEIAAIEIELEDGEKAQDAMDKAKSFIRKQLGLMPSRAEIERAKQLVLQDAEELPF